MNEQVWGPMAAFMASVTWVVGSAAYSRLSERYPPAAVNFNRALVATIFYLIWLVFDARAIIASVDALPPGQFGTAASWLAVGITCSYVIGDGLFLWSTLSIGLPAAQAISAIYPVWATLFALTVSGQWPTGAQFAGVLLAVGGVILVVRESEGGEKARGEMPTVLRTTRAGVVLALLASLFWAGNSLAVSRGGHLVHIAVGNGWRMMIALVLCPLAARLQNPKAERLFLSWDDAKRYIPFIAFDAIGGSMAYVYGLSHTSVAVGSTLSSLSPVLAVPIALVLGLEKFSWRKTLACVIVVAGVTLLVI